MRRRRIIPPVMLFLFIVGCAHGVVVDNTFVSDGYRFSVALPGAPYERIGPKDALVAVTDPETGISAAVAASPDPYPELTDETKALDYIARDLFFFLTKKEYRVFEDVTLDGAPARHVVLAGVQDEKELIFSAYVVRYYGTVYDIVVWCEPRYLDKASAVFQEMADTFKFRRGGGR